MRCLFHHFVCFCILGAYYLRKPKKEVSRVLIDKIALILAIVGGLNWGSIGIFGFDLVAFAFGGSDSAVSRIVYTLVGLGAVWCISLLFRDTVAAKENT